MGSRDPKEPSDSTEPTDFDKLHLNTIILHPYTTKNLTFDTNIWVETSYGTHQNNTNRAPEKSAGCESAGTETAAKEDSLYYKCR